MIDSQAQGAYRQIFKATSIFGGVQFFNILLSLLRGKVTALLLGSSGFGLFNLLGAPLSMIGAVTGLGIGTSAVRDMALAHGSGDAERFGRTVKTFRRWVWFTGVLGMVSTLAAAPWLSWSSFGHGNYTWAFAVLSVTLFVGAISMGQGAVMQATRRLKDMALSGILSATSSFLISIPLYVWWGINGVVPLLVIASFISLLLSWWFSRRVPVSNVSMTWKESLHEGAGFAKVGFALTLSMQLQQLVGYGITAFVSHAGGLAQAGMYAASSSITWKYAAMVFQAIGVDYYPRLAAVSQDDCRVREVVNQQAEISVLLIGAMAAAFMLLVPAVILVLLTQEFLPIVDLSRWVMLALVVKAYSWCINHVALAKSQPKLLLRLDVTAAFLDLAFVIAGYLWLGLEGCGLGSFLSSCIYLVIAMVVYFFRIGYRISQGLFKIFIVLLAGNLLLVLLLRLLPFGVGNGVGGVLMLPMLGYCYVELNKRINLSGLWQQFRRRWRKD